MIDWAYINKINVHFDISLDIEELIVKHNNYLL